MKPLVQIRSRRRLWALVLITAAACVVGLGAPHASADNALVSSSPADGETLGVSPTSLQLVFAEEVTGPSSVEAACEGAPISVGAPQAGPDGRTLTAAVPAPLPQGECVVAWRVLDTDDRPESGSFAFTIDSRAIVATTADASTTAAGPGTAGASASEAPVPGSAGSAATIEGVAETDDPPRVGGPLGLSRLASSFALATMFGGLVLIVVAWPEGVEYILTVRFMRSAWIVALAGTIGVVVFATAQVTGASIGASLNPAEWLDLADTTPGKALLARLALTAVAGWVVIRPERAIDPATQLPSLLITGLAVATIGVGRTGGDLAALGVVAGIVHAVAMAVWVGGLVLLSRVVLAGPGEADLVHAVRGFGRVSTPAVIATVASGAVQTYRLDGGALFSSSHGRVLLLKAVMVGAMVFVGLATREFIRTRLGRADAMSAPLAARLRRALGVEAMVGVVVLALAAWMLHLTPPNIRPAIADADDYAFTQRITDTDRDFDVTIGLDPQEVGANGVLIDVAAPQSGLADLRLTFIPPASAATPGIVLNVPLAGAGVAVLPASAGVPLEAVGVWTLRVEATTGEGTASGNINFPLVSPGGDNTLPDPITTVTSPPVTAAVTTTVATSSTTSTTLAEG